MTPGKILELPQHDLFCAVCDQLQRRTRHCQAEHARVSALFRPSVRCFGPAMLGAFDQRELTSLNSVTYSGRLTRIRSSCERNCSVRPTGSAVNSESQSWAEKAASLSTAPVVSRASR